MVDETTGESVEQGQGLLVLKRPWPGMLRTLYGDDERYVETYWSRFGPDTYLVGDAAIRDKDGYLWIVGRIDDVINVSGHRLSTAEVESAIVAHEKVAEAAVVAQSDELTGQAIVAFVTLQGDLEGTPEIEAQIRGHVAEHIGKLARPKRILWSDDLPKTRSGKIMRRLLRDIAEGRAIGDVTTLRDPTVMAELPEEGRGRSGAGGLDAMADAQHRARSDEGRRLYEQRSPERRSAFEELVSSRASACCWRAAPRTSPRSRGSLGDTADLVLRNLRIAGRADVRGSPGSSTAPRTSSSACCKRSRSYATSWRADRPRTGRRPPTAPAERTRAAA